MRYTVLQMGSNDVWAQCDLCQRWRRLPWVASEDDLPEEWTCAMSRDPERNVCSAPQEEVEEVHDESSDVFSVERLLARRRWGGRGLQYLVRWKGYDSSHDSWESVEDIHPGRESPRAQTRPPRPCPQRTLATLFRSRRGLRSQDERRATEQQRCAAAGLRRARAVWRDGGRGGRGDGRARRRGRGAGGEHRRRGGSSRVGVAAGGTGGQRGGRGGGEWLLAGVPWAERPLPRDRAAPPPGPAHDWCARRCGPTRVTR